MGEATDLGIHTMFWGEGFQATNREFGSVNLPLAQDRECEKLRMDFPINGAKKGKEGWVLKTIGGQTSKTKPESITDAPLMSLFLPFVIFSDTS